MIIPENYKTFSYRLCGSFAEKELSPYFKDLHDSLMKANIRMPLVEYLSVALTTAAITFFAETIFFSIIFTILLRTPAVGMLLAFIFGVMLSAAIFGLFYTYPSVKLGEREKEIEGAIPFATLYLSTIAGTGTPPIAMFKTLAEFKEYGEISATAESIVNETEAMGYNLADALENAARRTPSKDLEELLWGMRTILETGGDLRSFLHEKSQGAMEDYRRRLKTFSQTLEMFIEIYMTVVVVGSVFFMIMTTIMGAMSGGSMQGLIVASQVGVVFLFLPVASLAFIIMTQGLAPRGD